MLPPTLLHDGISSDVLVITSSIKKVSLEHYSARKGLHPFGIMDPAGGRLL